MWGVFLLKILFHCFFKQLASSEFRLSGSGNLNLLAGLRIDTHARGALYNAKHAKTRKSYLLATTQGFNNQIQEGIYCLYRLLLGLKTNCLHKRFCEFRFLHK